MAKKIRIRKKDLKRNEARELLEVCADWFHIHRKETEKALWGLLVVAILSMGSFYIYKSVRKKSMIAFSSAMRLYKTEQYDGASRAFAGLSDRFYEREKLFYLASINYKLGKYDESRKGFESFLKKFPRDDWASRSYLNLGHINEQLGHLEKALEIYKTGEKKYRDSSAHLMFQLALAGIDERIGHLDEARAIYEDVQKKFSDLKESSTTYSYVDDRLFWLKIKKDESTSMVN